MARKRKSAVPEVDRDEEADRQQSDSDMEDRGESSQGKSLYEVFFFLKAFFVFNSPSALRIASAATGIPPLVLRTRGRRAMTKARGPFQQGRFFHSGKSCLTGASSFEKYPSKINSLFR